MSNIKSLRVLSIIASLAIVISVGAFLTNAPCKISAQTICDIGDIETISTSLTLQDELRVGSTPSAGTTNSVLQSNGSGNSPSWTPVFSENIKLKTSDESKSTTTSGTLDSELFYTPSELAANSSYVLRGMLLIDSDTIPDFKFYNDLLSVTYCEGETFNTTTPDIIFLSTDFCGLNYQVIQTPATVEPLWFEVTFDLGVVPTTNRGIIWAQNTSDATPTIIKEGSWIGLTRIN